MTRSERARVHEALDAIRDALTAYVDGAMVSAYGERWDDHLAVANSQRRRDGRKLAVSKNDLAVLLKAILFERIEPWATKATYSRIRGYAGEILAVRNLFAHGDECSGEYQRLVDTAARMFQSLELAVPEDLRPSAGDRVSPQFEQSASQRSGSSLILDGHAEGELADELGSLGEAGKSAAAIFVRAQQIIDEISAAVMNAARSGEIENILFPLKRADFGSEALELFEALFLLEQSDDVKAPMDQLLLRFTRYVLSDRNNYLESAAKFTLLQKIRDAENYASSVGGEGWKDDREAPTFVAYSDSWARLHRFTELTSERSRIDYARDVLALAGQVPSSGVVVAVAIINVSIDLLEDESTERAEALQIVRECVARCRSHAARGSGSVFETFTAMFLRREGQILIDLDLPEEALKSFARADEIIDRFPTSDPELVFPGSAFLTD